MATITAAAGGGNWSSTATWVGGVVPTAADDVRLASTSGNVNIDGAVACRSLDCTGYTGTLTHNAFTLSIGDATAGTGNSALKLVSGMTYTLANVTTSAIAFVSTSATQQTVDFGGKSVGNLTFSTAGNWAVTSNITQDPTAGVTHSAGTLSLAGTAGASALTHSVGVLTCTGSTARTLNCGVATITGTRNGSAVFHFNVTGANLTFLGGSATFIGAPTSTGRLTYTYMFPTGSVVGTLILNGEGERTLGAYTVGVLTRNGTASYHDQLNPQNGATLTVTGQLNLISAGPDYRMTVWPSSTANPCTLVVAGATLNCQYIDWQDVTFDNGGANLDLSGHVGGSGDAGGNTIINGGTLTFTAATTQTWQGTAGGNWNDPAKWTSRVPLCQDNVIIGNMSGSPTITVNRKFVCRDFDASQGAGAFTLAMGSVYESYFTGNWTGRPGLALSNVGGLFRCCVRSNRTWTANGQSTPTMGMMVDTDPSSAVTFSNGWILGGVLTVRTGAMTVPAGATVSLDGFISTANLAQRKSIINLSGILQLRSGSGNLWTPSATPSNTVINDLGGEIRLTSTAAGTKTLNTGGQAFPDVRVVGGGAGVFAFSGGGSLPRLPSVYSNGAASITFAAGTTTTLRSPGRDVIGNGTNVVSIRSATAGSAATISKANGLIDADYLSLQDIAFSGGAVFSAGANSTNVSGNSGIAFTGARDWSPQSLIAA